MTTAGSGVEGTDADEVSPAARVADLLDRVWARVTDARVRVVVAGLVLLTLLRGGMFPYEDGWNLQAVRSFPEPLADWRSNSPLGIAVAGLAGVDTSGEWMAINVVLLAVALGVVAFVLHRRFPTTGGFVVAATWLSLSAAPLVLTQRVGTYDVFTVVGAVLVVLGRRPALALVGGVLIGATNVEQGALGLAGAVVLLTVLEGRRLRDAPATGRRHGLALAVAGLVVGRALVVGWFAAAGVEVPGRSDVFGELLVSGLSRAAAAGLAGVWAWLGGAWALVLLGWAVGRWSGRTTAWVVGALVLPGAVATATTTDGTRVFAMVSLPALLVLVAWVADHPFEGTTGRTVARATAAVLLVAPLIPAIISEPTGGVFFGYPWEQVVTGVDGPR